VEQSIAALALGRVILRDAGPEDAPERGERGSEAGGRQGLAEMRAENEPSQGVARNLGMEVVGRAPHGGYEHLVFAVSNPVP